MIGAYRPRAGVVWARVEEDFHVATQHGLFRGYIDRATDGTFFAYDLRAYLVGRFSSLTVAMTAVLDASAEPVVEGAPDIVLHHMRTPVTRGAQRKALDG